MSSKHNVNFTHCYSVTVSHDETVIVLVKGTLKGESQSMRSSPTIRRCSGIAIDGGELCLRQQACCPCL